MGVSAEKIAELIEDHHYEAKRALLHRFTRMEAEYRYYSSLFEKSFELERIKGDVIQEVMGMMEDKSERPDGIPISVLLNQSPEEKIEIEIKKPWECLGMFNQKRLEIKGGVGDYLGRNMIKGEIRVEGDVGNYAGALMGGGRIVIDGRTGEEIGYRMSGGEIWIKDLELGNLSYDLGKGSIYRGLPEGNWEPVRILKILENSKECFAFIYFDKREKAIYIPDKIDHVLNRVFWP